jgi:hypothetical protein
MSPGPASSGTPKESSRLAQEWRRSWKRTFGQSELDARSAKQLAAAFCQELFKQRYSEIVLFSNFSSWTPWFRGIAWDWTAFLFDRRKRIFAILATTDSD